MRDQVRRWCDGDDTGPVLVPPGFGGPKLPAADSDAIVIDFDDAPHRLTTDWQPLSGRGFVLVYEDADGEVSERRVEARACFVRGEAIYLRALCLERRAIRTFRVDRIQQLYCGITGEDLGPADLVLEPEEEEASKALSAKMAPYRDICRVLGLLVTLARADGQVHPFERRMLRGFIEQTLPEDEPQSVVEMLTEWAWRLTPSARLFHDGFQMAFMDSPRWSLALMEAARDMVEADGRVTAEEHGWMEDLIQLAEGVR